MRLSGKELMYKNQSYNPNDVRADEYGYVRLGTVREILETTFIHARNREVNIDEAVAAIEELLMYWVFEDCCSLQKQLWGGMPDEEIKEYLVKRIR